MDGEKQGRTAKQQQLRPDVEGLLFRDGWGGDAKHGRPPKRGTDRALMGWAGGARPAGLIVCLLVRSHQ